MTEWTPNVNLNRRFWVGCAVVFLGLGFLIAAVLQTRDVRALARDGVPIVARVTDTRQNTPVDGSSDDGTYRVTYDYTVAGHPITNERRVPEPFFNSHPTGTTWTIRVHPDDPTLHDLYPDQTKGNTWGLVGAAAVLIAIGGFFALSGGTLAALRARL